MVAVMPGIIDSSVLSNLIRVEKPLMPLRIVGSSLNSTRRSSGLKVGNAAKAPSRIGAGAKSPPMTSTPSRMESDCTGRLQGEPRPQVATLTACRMRVLGCAAGGALDEVRPRQGMMASPLTLACRRCPECWNGHDRGLLSVPKKPLQQPSSEPHRVPEPLISVNETTFPPAESTVVWQFGLITGITDRLCSNPTTPCDARQPREVNA